MSIETWVGTVTEPDEPVLWASMEQKDGWLGRWKSRHSFSLKLDDGSIATVDVSNPNLVVSPVEHKRGAWSTLEAHPAASVFSHHAPAPHAKHELQWFRVARGDVVTVSGSVRAQRQTGRPRELLAQELFSGRDVSRLAIGGEGVFLLLIAVASIAGAGYLFATRGRVALAVDLIGFAIAMLTTLAVARVHLRNRLGFIEAGELNDGRGTAAVFAMVPITVIAVVGFTLYREFDQSAAVHSTIVLVSSAITALWCSIWVVISGLKTATIIKHILRATPLEAPGDGTWGAVIGTVHDDTPLEDGSAMRAERVEHVIQSMDDAIVTQHVEVEETLGFRVRTSSFDVHVSPPGATWASSVRRLYRGGERPFEGRRRDDRTREPLGAEIIPQGASIVVVGRLQGTSMRATGPGTLLMFSAQPGDDPLRWLRQFLRRRRLWVVGALLAAAAIPLIHYLLLGTLF